jgi:hypothetical protein
MLALIDADGLIFACGFAAEKMVYELREVRARGNHAIIQTWAKKKDIPEDLLANLPQYFDDGAHTFYPGKRYITRRRNLEPLENALHLVKSKMLDILKETQATDFKVYIKGEGNFRDDISVTRKYKGNRDITHRPTYEDDIRRYLKNVWQAEEVDGMEVDDKVAIEQVADKEELPYRLLIKGEGTDLYKSNANTIICSCDKDLLQVPGWHYNYNKKEKQFVTELEGWRNFYESLLSGDPADNIEGVEGIGKIGATDRLKDCKTVKEMFEMVYDCYTEIYQEKASERLTEMANLVYLIRELDKDGKPVMWKPPI